MSKEIGIPTEPVVSQDSNEQAAAIQDSVKETTPPVQAEPQAPKPQVQVDDAAAFQRAMAQLQRQRRQAEKWPLPSRGFFNPELKDPGYVTITPMGGDEERALLTPRLLKSGEFLNVIFQSCIKDADPLRLTSADRTYLMYLIRSLSYGSVYDFNAICPSCNRKFDQSYDLDNLNPIYAPDGLVEPIACNLPQSGLTVYYNVERGFHEQELRRWQQQSVRRPKVMEQNEDGVIQPMPAAIREDKSELFDHRAISVIQSVETANGDRFVNPAMIRQIWHTLLAGDRTVFRNALNDPPFGIDTQIEAMCEHCSYEYSMELPVGSDFFFPQRIHKRRSNSKTSS